MAKKTIDMVANEIIKDLKQVGIDLVSKSKKTEKPFGKTSSGKDFHFNADHPAHKDFTAQDHKDAADKLSDYMDDLELADNSVSARGVHKHWKSHNEAAKKKNSDGLNKVGMFGATGSGGAIAASEDEKNLDKAGKTGTKSPLLAREINNYLKRSHIARKLKGAKIREKMRMRLTPQQIAQQFVDKAEEVFIRKTLSKNEAMVSMYKSGSIRLDFGAEVPEEVKKAALKWAERRGLKPVEASMAKSASGQPTYYVYNHEYDLADDCLKRFKWSID